MCTNNKWITNKYTGARVYAKCGKCKACQQEKAAMRANRIRYNLADGQLCIMVTLTYANDCCPYILIDDLKNHPYGDGISVYRDTVCRAYYNRRLQKVCIKRKHERVVLDTCFIDDFDFTGCKCLRHTNTRIGIAFYNDFQKYIERLRTNIKRYAERIQNRTGEFIDTRFSYFATSEYGEKSLRPHFHVLLFIPARSLDAFRHVHFESWPYDNRGAQSRAFEVAFDPAGYCASYVNCGADFPQLLKARSFKARHSYSQGFGMAYSALSLDKILAYANTTTFTYRSEKNTPEGKIEFDIPVPSYVINRYFPKFKGFSDLTDIEIYYVIKNAFRLPQHDFYIRSAKAIGYNTSVHYDWQRMVVSFNEVDDLPIFADVPLYNVYKKDDTLAIWTRLRNSFQRWCMINNCSPADNSAQDTYINQFIYVWRRYYICTLRRWYDDDTQDVSEKYDNVLDYYHPHDFKLMYACGFPSRNLDVRLYPKPLSLDPNEYLWRKERTLKMTQVFDSYSKYREVSDIVQNC